MTIADYNAPAARYSSARARIQRRLAAVVGADICGYSALMEDDEEETHREVGFELERFRNEIERSHGRIFSFTGDGLMAEFPSAVEALRCCLRVQAACNKRNDKRDANRLIRFRIGLNTGEIVIQQQRTGGTAVNIAARLEQIALPGGLCLSQRVFEQVKQAVIIPYDFAGARYLKNIKEPVDIYFVSEDVCKQHQNIPALRKFNVDRIEQKKADPSDDEYHPSIAVLPFRTLNPDRSDAYFAEGMVDDIIRALGSLRQLFVLARSSSQSFAGAPLDLRRIGHDLDVRYLVYGSLRRSHGIWRIAVELAEAQSAQVIWADRFEGKPADLFELQDRIAIRVATTIAPRLREKELNRAVRKHPQNMTAYDLLLQGLDASSRMDRNSLIRARALFERAIEHDPRYAPSYAHLAWWYGSWIGQGWSDDVPTDLNCAAVAARQAIELNPSEATALAVYGQVQSYLIQDYQIASDYFDRALAASPSCALAWGCSSLTLSYLRKYSEAMERAETAVRLCPLGTDAFWFEHFLSLAYYMGGRFQDAVEWGRLSDAHQSANASNLRILIASLVALGRNNEACEVAKRLLKLVPNFRLDTYRGRTPFRGEAREMLLGRLAVAGVPD